MGESVDYTERFDAALTHFGVKDIDDLDVETTKDFLKFVDTQNEMVISANSQKKLPVSDAHKERAAQDMLARAHMKDRLMAKASAEYKDAIKPKEKSDARKLFMRDRKASTNESVVVEDAGSRNATSPICTYCGGKLQTTKENHKTQGHSGKCLKCGKTN
jgi:NADH pyrophosphatase NudC (nudix superfamily)